MKNNLDIVIDAKYKSHIFNSESASQELKEEHRRDMHQLLAYTTFTKNKNKIGILCYPYSKEYIFKLDYVFQFSNTKSKILLLGIPLKKSKLNDLKKFIINLLSEIEREFSI